MPIFRLGLYIIGLIIGGIYGFREHPSYPVPEPIIVKTPSPAFCGTKSPGTSLGDELENASFKAGKKLFWKNCAQCHNKNMTDDLTGPALVGVKARWAGKEELLANWIRNSSAVIATGDPYAVNLFKKWDNIVMNPFPELTDQEITDLLFYIEKRGSLPYL